MLHCAELRVALMQKLKIPGITMKHEAKQVSFPCSTQSFHHFLEMTQNFVTVQSLGVVRRNR